MIFKLALLFIFSFTLSYAGTESSGGGGAIAIQTKPFEDQNFLQETLNSALEKIKQSNIPDFYKQSFQHDRNFRRIRIARRVGQPRPDSPQYAPLGRNIAMVPALFSVGFNRHPGDYPTLQGQCGFTQRQLDAKVYISSADERCYTTMLEEVMIHETFHHFLPPFLNRSEQFIEKLTASITGLLPDPKVERSFLISNLMEDAKQKAQAFIEASSEEINIDLEDSFEKCIMTDYMGNGPFYLDQSPEQNITISFASPKYGCAIDYSVIVEYDVQGSFVEVKFQDI